MKIKSAFRGLKWAYHQYAQSNDSSNKIKIYIYSQLLEMFKADHPRDEFIQGTLAVLVDDLLQSAVLKYGNTSQERIETHHLSAIPASTDALDKTIMLNEVKMLEDIEGDENWINISTKYVNSVMKKSDEFDCTAEEFSKSILVHVNSLNDYLSIQIRSRKLTKTKELNIMHSELVTLAAMYYAILEQLFLMNTALKAVPAKSLRIYSPIKKQMEKMRVLGAQYDAKMLTSLEKIDPIDRGDPTRMDSAVMEKIRLLIESAQGYQDDPEVKQVTDAAQRVYHNLHWRNLVDDYPVSVYRKKIY